MGREAPELSHAAAPEVSPHTTADDQVLPYLGPLTRAGNPAANPSSPDTSSKELEESSSEEDQPTNEAHRDKARQRAQHLDTNFDAWQHKKIAKGIPSWVTRDTMICDLPEHGKAQLNHPDPVGLPLEYMHDRQVFDSIRSVI